MAKTKRIFVPVSDDVLETIGRIAIAKNRSKAFIASAFLYLAIKSEIPKKDAKK